MGEAITTVGLCKDCNYALRDLPSNRCPECGREFDLKNPATMNMGRAVGPMARWILGPVGFPSLIIGVAPFLWLSSQFISPVAYGWGREFILPFFISIGLLALRGIWEGVRISTAESRRQHYVRPLHTVRGKVILTVILLFSLLVPFKVPLRIGFAVSRSEMEALLKDLEADPDRVRPPVKKVGIYQMETEIRPYFGVRQIWVSGSESGFAYSPTPVRQVNANPAGSGHLQGPWYWFVED